MREYYEARERIFDFIKKDAYGPVAIDEVLGEPPLDTYVCGILWPRGTQAIAVTHHVSQAAEIVGEQTPNADFGGDIEEEQSDAIREANQFRPSVMALSFALPSNARSVDAVFSAGVYENIDNPVEGKEYVLHSYKRNELCTGKMNLVLPKKVSKQWLFGGRAVMQLVRRKQISRDVNLWTISIENAKAASQNEIEQNVSSLFQCEIKLAGDFRPIDDSAKTSGNMDRQKQDFLYRKNHCYAVGHGCSAEWDEQAPFILEIKSTFLPKAAVSQMIAATDSSLTCFYTMRSSTGRSGTRSRPT